jgi:hypothetical protein
MGQTVRFAEGEGLLEPIRGLLPQRALDVGHRD